MYTPENPTEHATAALREPSVATSQSQAPSCPDLSASASRTNTIAELRQDNKLWYKLHVFIYDLRNFRSNEKSRNRLDNVVDTHYIGSPYFSAAEADTILRTIGDHEKEDKTLKELLDDFFTQKLEKRLNSRMRETADYRVCAAHDIAPIVEKAFRVHPKDLAKNKGFMKLVNAGGLDALDKGGVWKGLGKR
ncbi:hypothetical protein CFE70_000324 [Pyrenophora teres f. teres 0-1]|uniref:Uncharacterized protein n=1 Tax=Pyrenophora teres f. teres (strain 0-1) TaxID=861557 RepID=E3RJP4_PYRTT|nr:hypothetical protein PTT_08401 [Pyrenophora teres f. teres 0-1]